ncbi:DUF4422 domain-containing protein [Mitsuokella sp. WILCCON 0060]|uniref:DUF4422 domain-containing protein n=1 Tax=Mitsuokella sp. WILCCON 0060 TaxID=3345341 RepID=UPI003F1CE806
MKNKKIEIYVACHKPSELPKNELFIPIHVGAKLSNKELNIQRDDAGDNISEKNPQYCEMTAQYWAWKHSDADYIGLCHYRRYLNFTKERFQNFTPDNRKQVLVRVLNPFTEKKYGLLDKSVIEETIQNNDILVGEAQDLSKVNTPFGPKKTTLEHWLAHDKALINVDDLKKMFAIVEEYYPDIYKNMREYLDGKYFYGFNTFVLRADLFKKMCAFEFDVLNRLEKVVDLSHYNQQLSRIYGFMGEILFSSYIYYLKKTTPSIKVKECQMLYFDKTDPISNVMPATPDSKKIVIDADKVPLFLLYPSVYTLINNLSSNKEYDLVIMANTIDSFYKNYYQQLCSPYTNVHVHFKETSSFLDALTEEYGKFSYFANSFLPWILPNFDSCLYLRWNTLIEKNIDSIFDLELIEKPIAAVKSVYYQGILNTFYTEDKVYNESFFKIHNIYDYVSDTVFMINLEKLRETSLKMLIAKLPIKNTNLPRSPRSIEIFNSIYQENIQFLPHEYNWLYNTTQGTEFYVKEAPYNLVKEYQKAKKNKYISTYHEDSPWYIYKSPEFYLLYWDIVNKGTLSEVIHNHLIARHDAHLSLNMLVHKFVDKMLPKKTGRRELVKRLFPKGSYIYKKFYR